MADAVVVLVTVPGHQADTVALEVVESKLAACVNVVAPVRSFYWWDEKLHDDTEALLILKTTRDRVDAVVERMDALVSYDTVEVLALDVVGGGARYLEWLTRTAGS